MRQGINQAPRIRTALALGTFTAQQLAKMLDLHEWSVMRVLRRLKHIGQVKVVSHRMGATQAQKRVWGLR